MTVPMTVERRAVERGGQVRCGAKHFEALGVSFEVAVTAADV